MKSFLQSFWTDKAAFTGALSTLVGIGLLVATMWGQWDKLIMIVVPLLFGHGLALNAGSPGQQSLADQLASQLTPLLASQVPQQLAPNPLPQAPAPK